MKKNLLKSLLISLILVLGTSNVWGAVGFESYDCGIKYNIGGNSIEWNFSGQASQTRNLGNITTLSLKEWFARMYQNEDNTIYGQDYHKMYYKIHRTAVNAGSNDFTRLSANWWNWNGSYTNTNTYRYPNGGNNSLNVNLLNGLGSGKYTMTFYFQHNGKSTYKSTTNTLKWTYNIVPAINNFKVAASNVVSGTGTSADPYVIASGKSMTLTVSGSPKTTDANSSLYAKFGNDSYSSTSTKEYTSIPTEIQNITVEAKYYNSNDDLSGSTESVTIYYRAQTFNVDISANGNGEVSPNGTQKVGSTHTTITATPSRGYQFKAWEYTGGVVKVSENNTKEQGSITITATAAGTLTAIFEPIPETKYNVTISAGANGSVDPNGTQQIGASGMDVTATANTGYQFNYWEYTGGASVASQNSASTTISATADGTVTAHFTEIMRTITVATNNANYGSVSPASVTAGIATASSDITASPNDKFKFVNWTVSSNNITLNDANSAITQITKATANGTVTANFEEITHTIQIGVVSGQDTWGNVSATSMEVGAVNQKSISATAQTSLGYEFDHWELSDGITIVDGDANTAAISITATQAGTLTAHFRGVNRPQQVFLIGTMNNWKKSDATWQFYKLPGESGNTVTLTKTINKSDYHNDGYKFGFNIFQADWDDQYWKNSSSNDTKMDAHNCTGWGFNTKDGENRTYVDLNVSGEYTFTLSNSNNSTNQKLSITYPDKSFIEGDFATQWDENAYPLSEDGDIQSVTIHIDSKKDVQFRLVSHGKLFGTDTKILVDANTPTLSAKNMADNGAVMTIGAYVEGDYTFSYNKSTNVLTVTYPIVNQLQIYTATPAHDAATKNWDWDNKNGDVYSKTLSLNANTKYTFKAVLNSDFYGKNETTITRDSYSTTLNTSGGDVSITTDVAGEYTFNFNSSNNNLTVDYPTAYKLIYESNYACGTVSATAESNTMHTPNTQVIFTATPTDGHNFIGWQDGNGNTLSNDNPYTHTMNSDITIKTDFVTTNEQVVYLKPTDKWDMDNPTFAVHVWNNEGDATARDIPMTAVDCNGDYYVATIPAGFHSMVFYRKSTNGNDVWNKTADLIIPVNTNNCYTISTTGSKNPFTAATGSWSTYTEPTYDVIINAPESGTITVTIGGNTTTVTSEKTTIPNVALNAQMEVAFTPATGYKLGKAIIQIGNNAEANNAGTHTVCGPTEITAYFVTTNEQVVSIRPNGGWSSDNASFVAYAFNRYNGKEPQEIELTTKETDFTGEFSGTIPAGFSHIRFIRISATGEREETVDFSIPIDNNNRLLLRDKDGNAYPGYWQSSKEAIWELEGTWNDNKKYPLMGPDGKTTITITEGQAGSTFGFLLYHATYGSHVRYSITSSGTIIRSNALGDWVMLSGTDKCGLGVDIAGDYIFNFNIYNNTLTVTYPELPTPTPINVTSQRVFEDTELGWFDGTGEEATPYKLYNDEIVRLTVSALSEIPGLTAYYQFGDNEEQTSNVFDWSDINESTPINLAVKAYYKNATGSTTETVSTTTPYYIYIKPPFYLMSDPSSEMNIDRVKAGENILLQFRSDYAGTVSLYEGETKLTDIAQTTSDDYTYDVPDDIQPCVLHFSVKATEALHGRIFEAKTDVAIYNNVVIKVHDPEGWVKNAYLWRDYSDAVKTEWPGEGVTQNFGEWRVFTIKYPYYDRFIVNEGLQNGGRQTIDYQAPSDDTCYELLAPENNGSDKPEDEEKYGLKRAECPSNLIVSGIKDTIVYTGGQIVIIPNIQLGLGYTEKDLTATIECTSDATYADAVMSGMNISVTGKTLGVAHFRVTYTLTDGSTQTIEFTVTVKSAITIQVMVPTKGDYNIGWDDNSKIQVHYWGSGLSNTNLPMTYVTTTDDTEGHKHFYAQLPLGSDGEVNFIVFYEYMDITNNQHWRQTLNVENVKTSGCYKISYNGEYDGGVTKERKIESTDGCLSQYQLQIIMANGKTYYSNIVSNVADVLSFFAPGQKETGYRSGAVVLRENNVAIATIDPATFAESGVYTANLNDQFKGIANVTPYTGNYYIRTDGADDSNDSEGWNNYKRNANKMTYFVPRENEEYNHYWVKALSPVNGKKNVAAAVGNEYNDNLAFILQDDHTGTTEDGGFVYFNESKVNVRFGYDPRTNYFGRALLKGSTSGSDGQNFLNIYCSNAYIDEDCTNPLNNNTLSQEDQWSQSKLRDASNWVYEKDVYVSITNQQPVATVYLEATAYNRKINHLLGYENNEITGEEDITRPHQHTIVGSGTKTGIYHMRVIYDFKTNRMIMAWMPNDITIDNEINVHADVLIIRKENDPTPQINLTNDGKATGLETMYFAMELERGSENYNERHQEQYMFTLPFDCVVGEISGVPGYMQIWGLQRYRGDLRAKNGLFLETPTYWQWLSMNDTLKAGEGYLLVFDKKNAIWNTFEENGKTISILRLYFPSVQSGFDLQQQSEEKLIRTYPDHTCTIQLHNRYQYDSNWKMIGTTSYNNALVTTAEKDNDDYTEIYEFPSFRYRYTYTMSNDNKTFTYEYHPEDGTTSTYNSFFGYMVQFAGTIKWKNVINETVPNELIARQNTAGNLRTSITTRLEITNSIGEKQDQTFVALNENATTNFDQNKDLNKVLSSRYTNIYTLSENVPYAGNTLPMAEQTVTVGVNVVQAGTYTLSMPDGTDGISVILVDYQTGARTDLLLSEYTVDLEQGTYNDRFALLVNPHRSATGVEDINGSGLNDGEGIQKFLIDGKLIIRTSDAIYDAQGHKIK